jgi:hypothetical protein
MTDSSNTEKSGAKQPDLFTGTDQEIVLSRRKLPKYKQNPFIDDHLITQLSGQKNVYYNQLTQSSLLDLQTGEIDPARVQIVKQVRADKEQFVKIYTTHLKAFFELSTTAYKVLHYVLNTIQNNAINRDEVYLSLNKAQQFFEDQNSKISSTTFYKAMKELVEKLFIAETTEQNIYYINPKLFFNGDRVEFITKFMIEEKQTIVKLNNDKQKLQQQQKENEND